MAAADRARQRLGERDRTALIALAGVVLSFGVWGAWGWVSAILNNESVIAALVNPTLGDGVLRLSAMVVVMAGTLVAQSGYSQWFRALERLRIERGRAEQLYANSPNAEFSLGRDLVVEIANPCGVALAGIPAEAVAGAPCYSAIWGLSEPCDGCPAPGVLADGKRREREFLDTSSGTERWFDHLVYPLVGSDGSVESLIEVYRDVTSLRKAEEALRLANSELENRVVERTRELAASNEALETEAIVRECTAAALAESEARYRALVDDSPDMVLVHKDDEIVYLNPSGARLLGIDDAAESIGWRIRPLWRSGSDEITEDDITAALEGSEHMQPMHVLLARHDGGFVDVELSAAELVYGGQKAVQCVVRDITERVQAQRTIERMAFYDSLTGLPNRVLFGDRLATALARARRNGECVAVVFVDLDDFKTINDTLGHAVGDGVLLAVANRIRAVVREEDTVARHSGDEFTVIARVADRDGAAMIATRILESLKDPVNADGYALHVSASVGVAVHPFDGPGESQLLRNADTAMYCAKELGRNVYRLYVPEMSRSALDRLELETALRAALDNDEFILHFQPQVDSRTGRVAGVEALVRWQHPTEGILQPNAFIQLAEQAGFMGEIGHWVLRTACQRASLWLADGHDFGRICVNLSAKEFVQQDVVANVRQVLHDTSLHPSMLELEITESVAMHNVENVLGTLGELRRMGVRVAIDDFGTGFSSMSYLKRFPITTLKIAQDFMGDVHLSAQSAAIAGMVIDLCLELDLDIVAEGVEHTEQLEFLTRRGCNVIQGFLFSPPVAEDVLMEYLTRSMAIPTAEAV